VAGGGRVVVRVEVSADEGGSWTEASLLGDGGPGTWRFWETTLRLSCGTHRILARAFDSGGGAQPASVGEVWNFLGYANNAWHGVDVEVGG
jgi:sulfite oxidase